MRRLMLAVRGIVVLIALLCMTTATASRLAGQQVADSGQQIADSVLPDTARVTPVSFDSTALRGPRLRPDFQRVEQPFAANGASTAAAKHTFTITTLALVLAVIIIVLLVTD